MLNGKDYDQFKYRIVSWRGATMNIHEQNLTYDEFRSIVNVCAGANNMREFWVGIQSNITKDTHIPFLDFDLEDKYRLAGQFAKSYLYAKICGRIKKHLGKDGAFIFSSQKGFHVVPNVILSTDQYIELMKNMGCCSGFVSCFDKRGYSALRIGCKELRPDDVEFVGFVCGDKKPYNGGYNILPTIQNYIDIREELHAKMKNVYIYHDDVPIYPKFINDDPLMGFDVDENGRVRKRNVNPDDYDDIDY